MVSGITIVVRIVLSRPQVDIIKTTDSFVSKKGIIQLPGPIVLPEVEAIPVFLTCRRSAVPSTHSDTRIDLESRLPPLRVDQLHRNGAFPLPAPPLRFDMNTGPGIEKVPLVGNDGNRRKGQQRPLKLLWLRVQSLRGSHRILHDDAFFIDGILSCDPSKEGIYLSLVVGWPTLGANRLPHYLRGKDVAHCIDVCREVILFPGHNPQNRRGINQDWSLVYQSLLGRGRRPIQRVADLRSLGGGTHLHLEWLLIEPSVHAEFRILDPWPNRRRVIYGTWCRTGENCQVVSHKSLPLEEIATRLTFIHRG